jgi:archaellum component FlaF (FlaF/FlaG flagellin family)
MHLSGRTIKYRDRIANCENTPVKIKSAVLQQSNLHSNINIFSKGASVPKMFLHVEVGVKVRSTLGRQLLFQRGLLRTDIKVK